MNSRTTTPPSLGTLLADPTGALCAASAQLAPALKARPATVVPQDRSDFEPGVPCAGRKLEHRVAGLGGQRVDHPFPHGRGVLFELGSPPLPARCHGLPGRVAGLPVRLALQAAQSYDPSPSEAGGTLASACDSAERDTRELVAAVDGVRCERPLYLFLHRLLFVVGCFRPGPGEHPTHLARSADVLVNARIVVVHRDVLNPHCLEP